MKKLLLLIPLIVVFLPHIAFGACGSGYSFCRTVTVDHTQVPTTQTNFTVRVSTNHFVNSTNAGCTGSCTATTAGMNTTGSTLCVAVANEFSTDPAGATMSDSNGNSWHHLTTRNNINNGMEMVIWYAWDHGGTPLSVGAGQTFSLVGTSYPGISVSCYTGTQVSSDPFDVQNGAITSSGTTIQPGSITPSVDNEVVVTGSDELVANITSWSINSSYAIRSQFEYNGNINANVADITQGTAGATNPTWTSSNASASHTAVIASFKSNAVSVFGSLKTVANGGDVNNTTTFNGNTVPADVVFSSATDCSALMSWDIENYSASNGQMEAWVLVSSLSSSVNTTITMCYGKSAVTTYQGGSVGSAWDSNFKNIYHHNNDPTGTNPTLKDATTNGNNGTADQGAGTWSSADFIPLQIGNGWNYEGNNWDVDVNNSMNASYANTPMTWSFWANPNSLGSFGDIGNNYNSGSNTGFIITDSGGGTNPRIYLRNAGGSQYDSGTAYYAVGTSVYVTITYDNVNTVKMYKNGALTDTITGVGANALGNATTQDFKINNPSSWGGTAMHKVIDEYRIATTNRGADWITIEYNNQSYNPTFITVGSEQTGGGGASVSVPTFLIRGVQLLLRGVKLLIKG